MTDEWLQRVQDRYAEPGRFYHNWDHIVECLSLLANIDDLSKFDRERITFALVYHDVIYDTHAKDSEERSALFAVDELMYYSTASLDDLFEIDRLIRLTKEHSPAEYDINGQIMCDIDCAILGASHYDYSRYAANVRREYYWVGDDAWQAGRSAVLSSFLSRPRIYHSGHFGHLEIPARQNLTRELESLTNG